MFAFAPYDLSSRAEAPTRETIEQNRKDQWAAIQELRRRLMPARGFDGFAPAKRRMVHMAG